MDRFDPEPSEDIEYPPHPPSNPHPSDGSGDQPLNVTLSWSASDANDDIEEFDVFFSNDPFPDFHLVEEGHPEMFYIPGILNSNTTYYWRIIVRDSLGSENGGTVWSFTTVSDDS